MASRRDFVRGGLALGALAAGPLTAPLACAALDLGRTPAHASRLLVVVDRAFDNAGPFAAEAISLGARVHAFENDAAPIWMNALEPELRAGPLAIAGLTAPGTAFCLETLARTYRAAPLARYEHAPGADARLAPLLSAAAHADSALPPYAHVARADGAAPAFLTWLIATRG
jgi:hypothetical protein